MAETQAVMLTEKQKMKSRAVEKGKIQCERIEIAEILKELERKNVAQLQCRGVCRTVNKTCSNSWSFEGEQRHPSQKQFVTHKAYRLHQPILLCKTAC